MAIIALGITGHRILAEMDKVMAGVETRGQAHLADIPGFQFSGALLPGRGSGPHSRKKTPFDPRRKPVGAPAAAGRGISQGLRVVRIERGISASCLEKPNE